MIWFSGRVLALATHAAIGFGLTVRAVPPATVAADAGGFVVELADVATSRAETAPDLALGEEQRAQTAVAASEAPPPVTPAPPPEDIVPADLPQKEKANPEPSGKAPPQPSQPEISESKTTHMQAAVRATVDRASKQAAPAARPDPKAVAAWMQALQLALQKHKQYPEKAREKRAEGQVVLQLGLTASGEVQHVSIIKSSGFAVLDQSAQALVVAAGPFPPPPQVGANGLLRIRVPVGYVLK